MGPPGKLLEKRKPGVGAVEIQQYVFQVVSLFLLGMWVAASRVGYSKNITKYICNIHKYLQEISKIPGGGSPARPRGARAGPGLAPSRVVSDLA